MIKADKKTTPWNKVKAFISFLREYETCFDIKTACIDSGYFLQDFSKSIKGFYVYILVNPLTNKIFYIGKGKGNRALQHYKDYCKGKEKNNFKYQEINSFAKFGYKPIVKVLIDNIEEQEAYRLETKLIKRLYKSITNISQNENEPVVLKREVRKLLKRLPSYEQWIKGVYYNSYGIYEVLAQKDYGKSLYNSMCNAILSLGKEYGLCQM